MKSKNQPLNVYSVKSISYLIFSLDHQVINYWSFNPKLKIKLTHLNLGTGKTRTLVALIEQIVRTTNDNVLVCAMTNAACDVITEYLIDILNEGEFYRLYSISARHFNVSQRILKVANFRFENNKYVMPKKYPSLFYLYKFRVIICTSTMTGLFTRARIGRDWSAEHFQFIVIDECACAAEPISLIPIAGKKINSIFFLMTQICCSKIQAHFGISKLVRRFMYYEEGNTCTNRSSR